MLTKVKFEDDLDQWYDEPEEEILNASDISSQAAEAVERLAGRLGEKTTIACTTTIINEAVKKTEW